MHQPVSAPAEHALQRTQARYKKFSTDGLGRSTKDYDLTTLFTLSVALGYGTPEIKQRSRRAAQSAC